MGEFFKLGTEGDFRYFTLPHFLPIILMLIIIAMIYKYRDQLKHYKYEKNIRLALAFTMIVSDMSYFWQRMYIGADIKDHLPLTICGWACILAALMLLSESKFLFDIVYFWILAGSTNALITPAVITSSGPANFRYYQFWIEHTTIYIALFYMIFVFKMRPTWQSFRRSFIALAIFVSFGVYVNTQIPGANYFFLATTEAGDSVLNFLPTNIIIRILVMGTVMFILYLIAYIPYIIKDLKIKKLHSLKV